VWWSHLKLLGQRAALQLGRREGVVSRRPALVAGRGLGQCWWQQLDTLFLCSQAGTNSGRAGWRPPWRLIGVDDAVDGVGAHAEVLQHPHSQVLLPQLQFAVALGGHHAGRLEECQLGGRDHLDECARRVGRAISLQPVLHCSHRASAACARVRRVEQRALQLGAQQEQGGGQVEPDEGFVCPLVVHQLHQVHERRVLAAAACLGVCAAGPRA
jgi:hypothetical protein